jgi:hypothetical protein
MYHLFKLQVHVDFQSSLYAHVQMLMIFGQSSIMYAYAAALVNMDKKQPSH